MTTTSLTGLMNDSLDIIITTGAGDEASDALDAALKERSRRIAIRQAEIAAAEAAWIAEVDAAIEADAKAAGATTVTVKLTPSQSDLLYDLLPESLCGLTILTTRVKGRREDLRDALGMVTEDDALDRAERFRMVDMTSAQERFAERQVLRCVRGLCKAIRQAIR